MTLDSIVKVDGSRTGGREGGRAGKEEKGEHWASHHHLFPCT